MHLTLIFIVIIISYSTAYSHPLLALQQQEQQQQKLQQPRDELNSNASRPLQQFFIKILSAFQPKAWRRTTEAPATTTRISVPSSYHSSHIQIEEIPNFVDFSTYLLDSFSTNNSAIKFSYLQPNTSSLRGGNYSVISFLVPHDNDNKQPTKGASSNFLNLFRFPWNRKQPSDTVYSQFSPFLEHFVQRVQAYFSIYKYADESRLNNTIVVELPALPESQEQHQQEQNDDIIETTTDNQMESSEMETTELLTTEIYNEMVL